MAERRMFSKPFIESDQFSGLSRMAQLLYFHLAIRADDDGFISQLNNIYKSVGCNEKALKELSEADLVIVFESGVVLIKHWKVHNLIKKDRYKETRYLNEKNMVSVNILKEYFIEKPNSQSIRNPSGTHPEPQVRLGKDRLGKDRSDIYTAKETAALSPCKKADVKPKEKFGFYKNVLLTEDEFLKLTVEFPNDYNQRIEDLSEYMESHGKKYKSHLATLRAWARKEKKERKKEEKTDNDYMSFIEKLKGMRTEE